MTTTTGSGARSDAGYTLLEILIASALLLVIVSALLAALIALDERVVVDGERGDMMQRSRAAVDALALDLAAAGGAAAPRRDAPPIVALMPAVYPRRVGLRSADGADVFRTDAITVFAASPLPAIGTTLAQDTPARTTATRVAPGPGCPPANPLCAIAAGSDLLVADERGGFDLFTVTALAPPFIELRHHGGDGPALYPAGSLAVPVEGRTYYLRAAGPARPSQLVRYAGGEAFDTPVVDHVVSLGFEYVGVADPPRMSRALSDPWGVRTTYGPAPP
ncbi:MAG: prepilin-type N-terminal cleavage/methylation domain-containing protein, partial [Vicinamibacterales bacterium]